MLGGANSVINVLLLIKIMVVIGIFKTRGIGYIKCVCIIKGVTHGC
jgi:hypothetical protein